jgi:preprotein translocase subunit SecE
MHFIHNKINEQHEKRKISLGEFYVNYYEEYKPKQVQWAEYNKWRSKIVYVIIISIILAIIFYLHNK